MNICLIGNSLTNLVLAKVLESKNIRVTILFESEKTHNYNSRSLAISKKNYDYINTEIANIKKICWPINNIEIFKENSLDEKIFNFRNKEKNLFFVIKYNSLLKKINNELKRSKKIKFFKKKILYKNIIRANYDLIINSDSSNIISKDYFFRKITKDYKSTAFTTIIKHQKIKNNIAAQIFTDNGPLAFLPISENETSVVFSIFNNEHKFNEKEIKELILKYNRKFKIKSFVNFESFNLKYLILRKYFYKNILSFGDSLHKIHPLAGQGFNMTLRDIKILSDLIQERLDLGLTLDSSILKKFETETKSKNYIFSSGIDLIHEFFKLENKYRNKHVNKILSTVGQNNIFNKYISKVADNGLYF
tara:strand:- start:39 stop:1124 length:1086 start_codon:yes stop_codon:yes gene_type:complete